MRQSDTISLELSNNNVISERIGWIKIFKSIMSY